MTDQGTLDALKSLVQSRLKPGEQITSFSVKVVPDGTLHRFLSVSVCHPYCHRGKYRAVPCNAPCASFSTYRFRVGY